MTLDSSRLPTPIASFGLHPSRIQDSTFDLGGNRCARRAIAAPSPPASSRLPTPNPSFGLHPSRIQDSTFDLSGNRCACSAIAFKLYTFLGNDCLYERIHLVNTLGLFTWRMQLAYSLGVFTWCVCRARARCHARPLSARAPALVQSVRAPAFTWCVCRAPAYARPSTPLPAPRRPLSCSRRARPPSLGACERPLSLTQHARPLSVGTRSQSACAPAPAQSALLPTLSRHAL